MHISQKKLAEILTTSDVVKKEAFESAVQESVRLNQTLTNVLIGRGDITEDYLLELLEPYLMTPVINLRQLKIPPETIHIIPESFAKSKNIVFFEYDATKKTAKAAMLDPLDYETIEFLRAKFDCWIEPYITSTTSLKFALKQYKSGIATEFTQVISENTSKLLTSSGETDISKLASAIPVITILDSIIEHAVELGASDIHFEPFDNELLIRYRIDGILHEILHLHKTVEQILIARIKILANLRIDEHSSPQDGRLQFETENETKIDVRVNVMPVMHGEKAEMRLLRNSERPLSLPELGLSEENIKIISEEIKKPHGMFLVTGPTGHGKTTTLYAILYILNAPNVNIATIEDPIEYELPRVNQTQVNVKAGITFATGLRSLLRQNPDVMMVGEIRDKETAEIAIQSALTGHLVLSTLHTNDAPSALPRLLDMGAAAFLLNSTINMVIAQRLVRKICTSCISSYTLPPEMEKTVAEQLALSGNITTKIPKNVYKGKGCTVCGNSGFHGQTGIFEILKMTEPLRKLVLSMASIREIRDQAKKEGMISLFEDGLQKVQKGTTTIEEVLMVVRE